MELPEIIHNESRRLTIENILKVYRKRDGAEYQVFVNQVKRERAHLLNALGMSEAGHFLKLMEIPAKVYYLMVQVFGNNWMDDPQTAKAFMDVFRVCRLNEDSVPDFSKVSRNTEPQPRLYDPREIYK